MIIEVKRRTFAAANHPKGSPERARLNAHVVTSEYMTSYRYAAGPRDSDRGWQSFRSRREAAAFALNPLAEVTG